MVSEESSFLKLWLEFTVFDFGFHPLGIHHNGKLSVVGCQAPPNVRGTSCTRTLRLRHRKFYFSCSCYFCLKKEKEEERWGDKQGPMIKVYCYSLRSVGGLDSPEGILLSQSIQKKSLTCVQKGRQELSLGKCLSLEKRM